jgi:ribosomal-protein-alanine N-acetyltransferase
MPTDIQIRAYEPHDFPALYKLDQSCFPRGISYSKGILRYFLNLASAECLVAVADKQIAGFILSEVNAPLAHIITLDVSEQYRRCGVGSLLLEAMEAAIAKQGAKTVLLETAVDNEAGVAFWKRHGFAIAGTSKRYYLGRIDAYEMRKRLGFEQI